MNISGRMLAAVPLLRVAYRLLEQRGVLAERLLELEVIYHEGFLGDGLVCDPVYGLVDGVDTLGNCRDDDLHVRWGGVRPGARPLCDGAVQGYEAKEHEDVTYKLSEVDHPVVVGCDLRQRTARRSSGSVLPWKNQHQ